MKKETLLLGAYKEPMKKVEHGFGYWGAITLTTGGEIQCHVCGGTFHNLSKHVAWKHGIKVTEYREKYGIAAQTKLVSETERERLKVELMKRMAKYSEEQKAEWRRRMQKGRIAYQVSMKNKGEWNNKKTLEHKNLRGICPEQLIELIKRCAEETKETPAQAAFEKHYKTQRYFRPIKETFGSWNKALIKAGFKAHKRFGKGEYKAKYHDEELLEYLADFKNRTGKIPTKTDCNRGFLPSYNVYLRRYGSMPRARELAGII